MPDFDPRCLWFDRNIPAWTEHLAPLVGKPGVRALEVGCFEGRATLWLLDHVLTDPSSSITVIDTFVGSPEHDMMLPDYDWRGLYGRFCCNVLDAGWKYDDWGVTSRPHHVRIMRSDSADALLWMLHGDNERHDTEGESFDVIYLDGSHRAADVLTDAVLAWRLLKPGGLMIFDDWDFAYPLPSGETLRPRQAIEAFALCFGPQIARMITNGMQAVAWKQGD